MQLALTQCYLSANPPIDSVLATITNGLASGLTYLHITAGCKIQGELGHTAASRDLGT